MSAWDDVIFSGASNVSALLILKVFFTGQQEVFSFKIRSFGRSGKDSKSSKNEVLLLDSRESVSSKFHWSCPLVGKWNFFRDFLVKFDFWKYINLKIHLKHYFFILHSLKLKYTFLFWQIFLIVFLDNKNQKGSVIKVSIFFMNKFLRLFRPNGRTKNPQFML